MDDHYFTDNERLLYEKPRLQEVAEDNKKINWRKGDLLGTGAFGYVYLGFNSDTGGLMGVKQVALSKMRLKEDVYVTALEKEIALLRTLKHENIVQYLGSERTEEFFNIFLEYVPGGSIAAVLKKYGALSESVIRKYTYQILKGLEYLHSHQIMHRDIKGANILVDDNAHCKVADFGASVLIVNVSNDDHKSIAGTPYWMAPEVIKQTGHGRQADIWSVGCTMIEMACCQPPYGGMTVMVAMYKIAETDVLPDIPKSLSASCTEFIKLCLERDPKKRPNAVALLKHPFMQGVEKELSEPRVYYQQKPLVSAGSPTPIINSNPEPITNPAPETAINPIDLHNISNEQLKVYAHDRGMTPEALADLLGLKPPTSSSNDVVELNNVVLEDNNFLKIKNNNTITKNSSIRKKGLVELDVSDDSKIPTSNSSNQVMDTIISRIKDRNPKNFVGSIDFSSSSSLGSSVLTGPISNRHQSLTSNLFVQPTPTNKMPSPMADNPAIPVSKRRVPPNVQPILINNTSSSAPLSPNTNIDNINIKKKFTPYTPPHSPPLSGTENGTSASSNGYARNGNVFDGTVSPPISQPSLASPAPLNNSDILMYQALKDEPNTNTRRGRGHRRPTSNVTSAPADLVRDDRIDEEFDNELKLSKSRNAATTGSAMGYGQNNFPNNSTINSNLKSIPIGYSNGANRR